MKLWRAKQTRPLRFHDIRHTTASLLIMAGADLPAVQRIMRHTDPRITTEFYAQPLAGVPADRDRPPGDQPERARRPAGRGHRSPSGLSLRYPFGEPRG
jgi:integrase